MTINNLPNSDTERTSMESLCTAIFRGRISNYEKLRSHGDFLLNDNARQQAGLTALASAILGSGGAVGLAGLAGTKEEADRVEFILDNHKISGWLMWSPFKEGDEVEVVVEKADEGYQAYAVLRPSDRLIALYPHCSRGTIAHWKATIRWWLLVSVPLLVFTYAMALAIGYFKPISNWPDYIEDLLIGGIFCLGGSGLIAIGISRRFLPFVRMAEGIFSSLGWSNVKSIDLPRQTKKQRKPGDPPGLGTLYFRY